MTLSGLKIYVVVGDDVSLKFKYVHGCECRPRL